MLSNTSSKWIFSSYCWLSSFLILPPGKLCCLGFANSRHITGSAAGEENASLLELEGGTPWRCSALGLSTICVRNSQPQTKEIGKVFPLSALQILKIAIKHLDKISRWWQGKENDQSQAMLDPLNITYGLDIAVTRHSLILGEFSGRALLLALWQQNQITLWIGERRGKPRLPCLKV